MNEKERTLLIERAKRAYIEAVHRPLVPDPTRDSLVFPLNEVPPRASPRKEECPPPR